MKKYIIIFSLLLSVGACKKNVSSGVMIRIENETGFTLDSVRLYYDISNYNFGTILPGQKTGYTTFKSMPDGPAVTADSANTKLFAGHFIPPNTYPLPMLISGKYTLKIFIDSTLFYHFGAEFINN